MATSSLVLIQETAASIGFPASSRTVAVRLTDSPTNSCGAVGLTCTAAGTGAGCGDSVEVTGAAAVSGAADPAHGRQIPRAATPTMTGTATNRSRLRDRRAA